MRKLLLLVTLLLFSTAASSQIKWGVKGGLNLANMSNLDELNSKMKPSFYVGGFVDFRLGKRFSLQPELTYSRQGAYFNEGGTKIWMRYNYINLPVIAKIYIIKGLSLDLGPQISFLLNSKLKVKQGSNTATESGSDEKEVDFSIVMGLTYCIGNKIDITGRYNLGLSDLAEGSSNKRICNRVLQIGVGYRF